MSHYADYVKEIDDTETFEDHRGFATYKIFEDGRCYLSDIYVAPEFRKDNVASYYADEISQIAKNKGCTILVGSVNTQIKDPTRSMKVLLAYGMTFNSVSGTMLYFTKEIK